MTRFTMGEIQALRQVHQRARWRFSAICSSFAKNHTRDEMVEAVDAIRRFPHNGQALDRVNFVLHGQEMAIPLINGRPFNEVDASQMGRKVPMF